MNACASPEKHLINFLMRVTFWKITSHHVLEYSSNNRQFKISMSERGFDLAGAVVEVKKSTGLSTRPNACNWLRSGVMTL